MTLADLLLEKPTHRRQVWLIGCCYPQNIQRTLATAVNELGRLWRPVSLAPNGATSGVMDQTACKPGSVPPEPKLRHWRSFLWTAPRGTVLATYPDRSGLRQPYPHR